MNYDVKDMQDAFLKRLKELTDKESSPRSFAIKAGINETTLRGIINGSLPRLDNLLLIAKAGNVSVSWLVGEDESEQLNDEWASYSSKNDEFIEVPFYQTKVSAGHGSYGQDAESNEDFKPLLFRKDWLEKRNLNAANLVGAHVSGDSMKNIIPEGSDILIDTTAKKIENGKIYVFNAGGELLVKKLVIGFDNYTAVSLNDDGIYEDIVINKAELQTLNLVGRAVISLTGVKL